MPTDAQHWKSSVLRCYESAAHCKVCAFLDGNRTPEVLEHVVMVLDSALAEAEKAERSAVHALFKMKEERDAD